MSMLSSVAERLYWMSRYLERTQDTARLIQAYNHLIMDIPKGAEPPWDIMIDILDAQPLFRARFKAGSCLLYTSPSPRDVVESRMPSSA